MTMHRLPVLNFTYGLLGVSPLHSLFPVVVGGGFVSTPKVPSSCLDLGPVVRDRVRFAAMSKTWNILLSGYHNLGFYKVCSPSGMLVGHCSPNA